MGKKPPDAVRDTGDWELEMQWEREIILVIRLWGRDGGLWDSSTPPLPQTINIERSLITNYPPPPRASETRKDGIFPL